MRDFINFIKEILIPVICILLIVGIPMFSFIYIYDKASCKNYSTITGRETSFTFAGGCFVKSGESWLTKNEYGNVIIAREGLSQAK